MNNFGIRKETGAAPVDILFSTTNQMSVGVVVAQSAGTEGMVKAGTPLTGSLKERTTAFTKASSENVVGVLLHDVDVSEGDNNATLLINGYVNFDRLDPAVAELITSDVEKALAAHVVFLK